MKDLLKNPNKIRRYTNDEVFVENSTYARHNIKNRVIKQNLIIYECKECKNTGYWNGKSLVLQLEHKNGKNDDHRLCNLAFMCPNCHSQTDTYGARNRKNPNRSPKAYIDKNGILRNLRV